jgi:PAS domain-containing protein
MLGAVGYASFPPPLPAEGFSRLLLGFVVISGTFSWIVARRYEVEAALRSSETRLKEAQAVAHVGSWQWDVAANSLWWSDEVYRIFGVDRASFRPSYAAFLQRVHPADRSTIERAVLEAVQERKLYDVEHRIVRPDGDVRVINGHGRMGG